MTANEIRQNFLKFFESKQHTIVESDSLVPKDDPTVLFTTAGMQQFKRQFLGHIEGYTRATTSQKCMRTDDLDEVGKTDFHHTFFEMLGNFSFGDYFKKDAIAWGWEFLTKELGIPEEKLWVSVYEDDAEAREIWLNDIKIDASKLVALGDRSNFWPADARKNGPNGPCGPCSEIFYDWGEEYSSIKNGNPGNDETRFSEVWNLVFTQFNRKEGGELDPLPNKNIDTGMGLERLAAVLQGKRNNYETDLFEPILKAIDTEIIQKGHDLSKTQTYIIADHIRGIVFGMADGVIASNEGRGYVIKKLIIDITDIVLMAGNKKPVIHKLVPSVIEAMGQAYPYLASKEKEISNIIEGVENSYMRVRQTRMPELKKCVEEMIASLSEDELTNQLGKIVFTYRDTYGLTLPAIETTLLNSGITKPQLKAIKETFEKHMTQQKEQSRASSKMTGDVFTGDDLELSLPKTDFLGYEHAYSTSTILKLFINNKKVDQAQKGDQIKFVLDKTPFYAESGGQVGDTGLITTNKGEIEVTDTQKIDDIIIHVGTILEGSFKTDDLVKAEIDLDRRLSIMCNHTSTHLLQAALRDVLGSHIKQQGSFVDDKRLRFDFTHPKQISDEELVQIENEVNMNIRSCDTVTTEYMPIEQAKESGALAFFAEKYGKEVRVVTIGDYSKEFCGGTHLMSTGQVGLLKITSENAIAQGIRRIEAKTGPEALNYIYDLEQKLTEAAKTLKSPKNELIERIKLQTQKLKQIEKDYDILKFEAIKTAIVAGLDDTEQLDGLHVYSKQFSNVEMTVLRKISDFIKQKLPSSIIILGAKTKNNASILITSSDDAIKKGYKANEMIKEAASKIGGSGGGRPQLAQAGGKDVSKLDEAITSLNNLLRKSKGNQ